MSNTQPDLDYCSEYLELHPGIRRAAHLVGLRIGDGEAAAARASFMSMIHADCLRYGSFEGFVRMYAQQL